MTKGGLDEVREVAWGTGHSPQPALLAQQAQQGRPPFPQQQQQGFPRPWVPQVELLQPQSFVLLIFK